jgi:hypothetical protein
MRGLFYLYWYLYWFGYGILIGVSDSHLWSRDKVFLIGLDFDNETGDSEVVLTSY